MAKTIGNPLSWLTRMVGLGSRHIETGARELGAIDTGAIETREITLSDLKAALKKGFDDFIALRTDVIFIVLIYPLIGFILAWFAFNNALIPLIFPLISGFALLGPLAAVGLYELSRRREQGLKTSWVDALKVVESPSFIPIIILGAYLVAIFLGWMAFSYLAYFAAFGSEPPTSATAFMQELFSTRAGWLMQVISVGFGFIIALIVLAISFVSFPLLLDRHVGLAQAVLTSVDIARKNPVTVLTWGAMVVVLLGIGFLTLFAGLIVILPVLGHATWHVYRRAVVQALPKR